MCLFFDKRDIEITEKLRKGKKPIIAYKILVECFENSCLLFSPVYGGIDPWKPGKIKRSSRASAITPANLPTILEIEHEKIELGIHCYRTRKIAREAKKPYWGITDISKQIWKVEIQPKDVVMTGNHDGKEIVATKVKLLERVRQMNLYFDNKYIEDLERDIISIVKNATDLLQYEEIYSNLRMHGLSAFHKAFTNLIASGKIYKETKMVATDFWKVKD